MRLEFITFYCWFIFKLQIINFLFVSNATCVKMDVQRMIYKFVNLRLNVSDLHFKIINLADKRKWNLIYGYNLPPLIKFKELEIII